MSGYVGSYGGVGWYFNFGCAWESVFKEGMVKTKVEPQPAL